MNRLVYFLFSLPLLLSFLTSVEAGPACARRNQGLSDCVEACKKGWGWPGFAMGTDRWGSVMTVTKTNDLGSLVTQACRVRSYVLPILLSSSSIQNSYSQVERSGIRVHYCVLHRAYELYHHSSKRRHHCVSFHRERDRDRTQHHHPVLVCCRPHQLHCRLQCDPPQRLHDCVSQRLLHASLFLLN